MIITSPSAVATLACNFGENCCYFYSTKLLWRTLGGNSIPWFMTAQPFFFSNRDEFQKALGKVKGKVKGKVLGLCPRP